MTYSTPSVSSSSSVPLFHSLGSGTMEQTLHQRNSPRNSNGTFSLKALANKVLERNNKWNKPGTEASKSVPHPDQNVPPLPGTNPGTDDSSQYDALSYAFEERTAIAEYDGNQTSLHAGCIAYLDAFISILSDLAENDPNQDWLQKKIQITLETLNAQQFATLN